MNTTIRALVRYGYFPLMFFGLNGVGIALAFTDLPPLEKAAAVFALLGTALVFSFGAERLVPYTSAWNNDRGDLGRDIVHFLVNESMSLVPLLIVPIFIVAAAPAPVSPLWPSAWPLLAQVVFTLTVFDLGQLLFHQASHRWDPLWRLHAVHHSVERMYGFNGIMKHPIYQILASVVSLAPLVLLGMPDAFSLVIVFCTFIQLLLQHSNTDYRTGWGRHIIATAEVHRFHHLRGKDGDINFALFFSFWDRLFGNAYYAERGLETRDIGLDYADYPMGYLGQLAAPFRQFDTSATATLTDQATGR